MTIVDDDNRTLGSPSLTKAGFRISTMTKKLSRNKNRLLSVAPALKSRDGAGRIDFPVIAHFYIIDSLTDKLVKYFEKISL